MGSHRPFQPAQTPAYAGWVPTITGQLSFSLIGLGGAAPDCVTANVEFWDEKAGHPRRRVAVVQRRVTRDLPLTVWPVPYLFRSIAAEFILVGETQPALRPIIQDGKIGRRDDEIGVLAGELIVLPFHDTQSRSERALIRKIRKRIAAAGDSTPRAVIGSDAALGLDLQAWIAEAARAGLTLARFRFELYRTGEFRIEQVKSIPVAEDADLDQDEFDAILASQTYYFVKDIAHRHYHHRPSTDNLLPLTPLKASDDVSWRRETLWSLARAVLEMRRSGKLPGHKSALGVLAYAEAFQGLLARVERGGSARSPFRLTHEIACYDFTHTRQSLEATIAEKGFIHSHSTNLFTLAITTCLAVAALWLAIAQVKGVDCLQELGCARVPEPVAWLMWQTIERPHLMAAALLILAAIYVESSRRSLMVVTPLRVWGEFIGSWFDALGATISRWARKRHPTWGDQIGATIAWVYSVFFVTAGLHTLGAVIGLWPLVPLLSGVWAGSILSWVLGPIITRILSRRAAGSRQG